VWHVSIASQFILPTTMYEKQAKEILRNVGDSSLGEWSQKTKQAYHLRRRISTKEQEKIGPAIDIRGTEEEIRRLDIIKQFLPKGFSLESTYLKNRRG
jgi:hypothetical protein